MNFTKESLNQRHQIIEAYTKIVLNIRDMESEIEQMLSENNPSWKDVHDQRNLLLQQSEQPIREYWRWINPVLLSQCPFCRKDLYHYFDPIDLNGFWWMERTSRPIEQPPPCPHFRLFLGALNFNNVKPKGGLYECRPGPDVPYIIPRILNMSTMVAVISIIPMFCGYKAYPIIYYSETPPVEASLYPTWTKKQYTFTLKNGTSGWNSVEDYFDFNLRPWIKKGKVRSYIYNQLNSQESDNQISPLLKIEGERKMQILIHNELSFE